MEPSTYTDYELHDADGQHIMFSKANDWTCSNLTDEAEARTFAKDGVKLYRRTITTAFEEVA